MLVFAGVVKKCLQNGHSFRLAGVWLKSENLRFACAVTRFCSSRVKKNIRNLWFSIIRVISGRHSLFQFFPLLDASGARALVAKQNPQSATRQRCDTMSSCRPMCTFLCARFGFFCGSIDGGRHNMMPPIQTLCYLAQPLWQQRNIFSSDHIYISFSVNIYKSRHNNKFEPTPHPPPPSPPWWSYDSMCNVCIFRNVKEVLVKNANTPPWWSYHSMCNVCIFRSVKEVLVKNVNTPPHPPPPPPWWSYDSMCNMLKTQKKKQILYPHLRKPHFWNLQPFQGIVNGTSQNWQPFQGRRISRMP